MRGDGSVRIGFVRWNPGGGESLVGSSSGVEGEVYSPSGAQAGVDLGGNHVLQSLPPSLYLARRVATHLQVASQISFSCLQHSPHIFAFSFSL